jgi:hypothetical protein
MRIDHWSPRSSGGHDFQWSNLVGSCLGETTCDASKAEIPLFLHPVEGFGPDPRHHLRYLADGSVAANDKRGVAA